MLLRLFRQPSRSGVLLRARTHSTVAVEGVTIVRTVTEALRVAAIINKLPLDTVHAWDTEVIDIDLDTQSPVGHGTVICASFFSGENIDYGTGSSVWIDAYSEQKLDVLLAFKHVLESPRIRKVWHNYGFDRHVLGNHGIEADGFWADTMHMARLHNSSRDKMGLGGYSLAKLSEAFVEKRGLAPAKRSMMDLFGVPVKKKDGSDGKKKELPPLDMLQTAEHPALVARWIGYSSLDARVTWHLYQVLRDELSRPGDASTLWKPAPQCFADIQFDTVNAMRLQPGQRDTEAHPPVLWELYERVHRPFGQLLTDMERRGMLLDQAQIATATAAAQAERSAIIHRFKAWAAAFTGQPDMHLLNVHSDAQKAQLLFGLPPPAPKPAKPAAAAPKAKAGKASKDTKEEQQAQEDVAAAAAAAVPLGLASHESPPVCLASHESPPVCEGAEGKATTTGKRTGSKGGKKKGKGAGGEEGAAGASTSTEAQVGGSDAASAASVSTRLVSWRRPERRPLLLPLPHTHSLTAHQMYRHATRHSTTTLLPTLLCGLLRWFSTDTWAASLKRNVRKGGGEKEVQGEGAGSGGTVVKGARSKGEGRKRRHASSMMLEDESSPALAAFDRLASQGETAEEWGGREREQQGGQEAGEGSGTGAEHAWTIGLGYSSSSDSDAEIALQVALAANDSELSSSGSSSEEEEGEQAASAVVRPDEDEEEGEEEIDATHAGGTRGSRGRKVKAEGTETGVEVDEGQPPSLLASAESDSEEEEEEEEEEEGVLATVAPHGPIMGGYQRPPPPPVLPVLVGSRGPSPQRTATVAASGPGAGTGTGVGPGGVEFLSAEYEFETDNTDGWTPPDRPVRVDKKSGEAVFPKKRPFSVPSLFLPITERTPKGRASGTAASIKKLLGKPLEEGVAYKHLVSHGCAPEAAKEACLRIQDLLALSAVDTVLETFLLPLATAAANDAGSRVHCSLNLNTETGRLSARRPNLQNQPSLERDKFKIRSAFIAPPAHCLVVADYGQLELRVLAHLTGCQSMIEAFKLGGDFHSRTAMGMYKHVRAAVDAGEVLLEWPEDGSAGPPPKPLLKDKFKEERRKAKILNFSIAYGKTAYGLSKDWGVSLPEAEETVRAWYADRPEVERWQVDTKANARNKKPHRVYTILGRHRDLPGINDRRLRNHLERAAINTPIQGSAADIVMCAMLRLAGDEHLTQRLGFHQVLQVHDEVVLEGPQEHGGEAMARVVELMGRPFDSPLLVDLAVDAKVVRSWGDAK